MRIIDFNTRIYPCRVISFFVCSNKEIDRYLIDQGLDTLSEAYLEPCEEAKVVEHSDGIILAVFSSEASTPKDLATVCHEIFHITSFIASYVGLSLTDDSEEAYAYLYQYIAEEIFDGIKKWY